jgi:putative GTP pyrophosphokinase
MPDDDVINKILDDYALRAELLDDFRLAIEVLLSRLIGIGGLHMHSISSRLKTRGSLAAKVNRIGKHYSALSEVTDIVGLRVITNLEDEVDEVGQLIEHHFAVDLARSIDKRQVLDPDRFGYLSLHYVCGFSDERLALAEYERFKGLCCEIQVRSMLQHAWAEVEHDLGYKVGATIPSPMRRRFSRLAGLLEIADSEFMRLRDELRGYTIEVQSAIVKTPDQVGLDDVSLRMFVETDRDLNALEKKMADFVGATLELQPIENLAAQLRYAGIDTIGKLSETLRDRTDLVLRQWEARVSGESRNQLGRGIGLFHLFQVLVVLRGGSQELSIAFERFKVGWSSVKRAKAAGDVARSILAVTDSKR